MEVRSHLAARHHLAAALVLGLITFALSLIGGGTAFAAQGWVQRGSAINGVYNDTNSNLGSAVAISGDGSLLVTSAPFSDRNGADSGYVSTYTWNSGEWSKRGSDISGVTTNDSYGRSVSLSSSGSRLALCGGGGARVYAWSGSAWVQLGSMLVDCSRVALSSDGSVVAVGDWTVTTSNGVGSGRVRVYAWNGSAWTQQGSDIDGQAAGDGFGFSVSLSDAGALLAVGALSSDANGDTSGQVRTYAWSGSSWVQRGSDLNGASANEALGKSVSLSSDGSVLAIGTNANLARVYSWMAGAWNPLGTRIARGVLGDGALFGDSVSLSGDGTSLAVGARGAQGTSSGWASVYRWDEVTWSQIGLDILGEATGDSFGAAIAMSRDGLVVAVGAPDKPSQRGGYGQARMFGLASTPGQPTRVIGTSGVRTATVSWDAPTSDGGAQIVRYDVVASPGGSSCSWSSGSLQCTITGLSDVTPYTFTVTATNGVGSGAVSAASDEVKTPSTVPSAPQAVRGVSGDHGVLVSWSAPSDTGGAPITRYAVTARPGGAQCSWLNGPLQCSVSSLENGVEYTFTVRAVNEAGASEDSSPSAAVTPLTPPPLGSVGISVLDGAQYTNSSNVSLDIVWPRGATSMTISNDGGFRGASVKSMPVVQSVDWILNDSVKGAFTKVVYVRFDGPSVNASQTFSDDIILDTTPPDVVSASIEPTVGNAIAVRTLLRASGKGRAFKITIRAKDKISGVKSLQFAGSKTGKKAVMLAYRRSYALRLRRGVVWYRIGDVAGNFTPWRRLAVK